MAEIYFTGKRCKNGHSAPRYVSNNSCMVCIADANRTRRLVTIGDPKKRTYAKEDYTRNKVKRLARNRAWQKANPEKMKGYRRRYSKLNKHVETAGYRRLRGYPTPTRAEPLLCECCGGPPGKRAMNLDHCHETGKFRGWLCQRCNTGLGLLGDNAESLHRALRYLERIDA